MNKTNGKIWFLVAIAFAICLTIFMLSYIVTQPWHILPDIGGDGAKNNFTYLYESMYGTGYWFHGMNYPYGEHIVYTDGIPLLSLLFVHLGNVSSETALTVLWLLLGLSYVLSIIYLYLILTYFRVAPLIAVFFAGLIGIFTPQLFCISGHYALGFACVIPMLFYWTIKYHEQFHWKYCIYFLALGVVMSFLHPYYAGMMLVWVMFYSLGYFIFIKKALLQKVKYVAPLFISVLLVMCAIAVVMKLTDPVKDRPSTPFNTLETCTSRKQVISSVYSPYWQFIKKVTRFSKVSEGGEGYTYTGVVVLITVLLSLFTITVQGFRKKKLDIGIESSGFSPVWLFMALAVLLFSMGVPFIWIWELDWVSKYFSILKQFRALGRFSWIFYYIITVYSVVVIYTCYVRLIAKQKVFYGYAVLILSMVVWGYEASGYAKFSRGRAEYALYYYDMMFSKKEQNWDSFLQEHKYHKSDFQAVLLLPFFHVGTEKLWIDADWVLTMGTKAGLQLLLPIVDVMLSRSSWAEAKKQVRIAAGPYAGKPVLDDINNNKAFLLMQLDFDSLDRDQKYLLQAADYIGHYSQCYVYACYPERLRALYKKNMDSVNHILPFMSSNDTCIEEKGNWFVAHFDSGNAAEHFFGNGAMACIPGEEKIVASIPVKAPGDSQLYEFSCWFLLGDKNARSPFVAMQMLNSEGATIGVDTAFTRQSVDNHGMWFRDSKYFYIHKNVAEVRCKLVNFPNPAYMAMDEMMLRPADALIISKAADGSVMANNHLLETVK